MDEMSELGLVKLDMWADSLYFLCLASSQLTLWHPHGHVGIIFISGSFSARRQAIEITGLLGYSLPGSFGILPDINQRLLPSKSFLINYTPITLTSDAVSLLLLYYYYYYYYYYYIPVTPSVKLCCTSGP
jgi:hypothetical protein